MITLMVNVKDGKHRPLRSQHRHQRSVLVRSVVSFHLKCFFSSSIIIVTKTKHDDGDDANAMTPALLLFVMLVVHTARAARQGRR